MNKATLTIDTTKSDVRTIVQPRGDINITQSPALRTKLKAIIEEGSPSVILDLSEVKFMDSSGIATLIETLQICRNAHIPFLLCSLQVRVRSVFEISRLETVFRIYDSLDSAIQADTNE